MKNIKEIANKLYYGNKVYLKDSSGSKYKIEVVYDYCAESPRKWEPVCHIMSVKGNWDIADKGLSFSKEDAFNKLEELEKDSDIIIKPIYMYDHSGQTIQLIPFGDRWDSGVCGYIYANKDEIIRKIGNATEENWKERARKIMEGEIEIYDQYIRGEVYGFRVYKEYTEQHKNMRTGEMWYTTELEEIDSCCGFYGTEFDKNGLLEYALGNLPDDIEIIKEEE